MNVTTLQIDLAWEDKVTNLQTIDAMLAAHQSRSDIIVLPEMFTTGFSMQPGRLAESMQGATLMQMQQWAVTYDAAVCGSVIIEEQGCYFNRFLWVEPSGKVTHYDKRHLFGLADEPKHYTAGQEKMIIEWRGWKICPLICYDVRFPVWSRNVEEYDMLIYVANFPKRRIHAWKTLLLARAIENQCFTIGVNRVGYDGNGIYHDGTSLISDFEGNLLYEIREVEAINTYTLDKREQQDFRRKLPFLKDRDTFQIAL